MSEKWKLMTRSGVAVLACLGAIPLLVAAFSRPEPPRSPDPQMVAFSANVRQSSELLSAQQESIEKLKAAHRLDTENVDELRNQVQRLTELVQGVSDKLDGAATVSQNAAAQLNYLHGRLGRVETSLTRIDADINTPQKVNLLLERQKALARP